MSKHIRCDPKSGDPDIPFSRTAKGSCWIVLVTRSFALVSSSSNAKALAAVFVAVLAVTCFRGTLREVIGSTTFSSGLLVSGSLEEEDFPTGDTMVKGEC